MLLDRGHINSSSTTFCPDEDPSLCASLYRYYASGILAYLRRHLPTQEDAEDLLLEVFLSALEHETHLANRSEDEQRAWLVTVARNRMIDYYRRTKRRHLLPLEMAEDPPGCQENTPENLIVREEEHELLRLYLQRLPTTQQEVLQLRFTVGLRCAEIASILNKREGAIRTMLSRALNTVRGFYQRKDQGEQ
jgi:RNA polymerase sigma factor (sigma-70 family)